MSKFREIMTDTSLFRRSYIYCMFFCTIAFIQVFAYAALVLLFLWGVFLLFYNEKKRHVLSKTRFGFWLLAFVFFSTITAVIHITDNFLFNVVVQLQVCICFFIFYGLHTEKHLNFRKELFLVARFIIYVTTVVGVLGLACLMAGISFEVMSIKLIIYENRFTGIYSNPNVLGFISVVALISVHMMTKSNFVQLSSMNRISRIWLLSAVAINCICLFLCDSYGALVLLVFYIIAFVLYKMFGSEREFTKKQIVTKLIALVLAGAFIVGSAVFVKFFTQAGFTEILEQAEVGMQNIDEDSQNIFSATERITFSHINKNLDSGRFKLWRQAASLFSDFPLFGIGKGNVYDYGESKFDNGIAFSDLYGEALSKFATDFHNGYATILVCSGLVGFVLFSIFGLRFAKHIFIHVFKAKNLKESIFPCLYAFLCAYLVYAFVEKTILYDISFIVQFFWLIMGYTSCFLCMYEPDYHEEINFLKRRINKNII